MKAIAFDLLEVTINIATKFLKTPFKKFEKVTISGVMLTWQELKIWMNFVDLLFYWWE